MSNSINTNELMHYGVKGMKWGKRMARGHAGPGLYLTKKRQLAGDKRDLAALNKGEHLSVGLTKKRQAAFDKRDKAALEKRIAKNETEQKTKLDKKAANPNRSREIAIGVGAAAGTALAAYGAYKVSNMIKNRHLNARINSGQRAAESFLKRGYADDAISTFKERMNWAVEDNSMRAIIKNSIQMNSVGNKVNWKDAAKYFVNGSRR